MGENRHGNLGTYSRDGDGENPLLNEPFDESHPGLKMLDCDVARRKVGYPGFEKSGQSLTPPEFGLSLGKNCWEQIWERTDCDSTGLLTEAMKGAH